MSCVMAGWFGNGRLRDLVSVVCAECSVKDSVAAVSRVHQCVKVWSCVLRKF